MIDGSAVTLKSGEIIGGNYIITDTADVEITVYDQDGVEVRTLSPGELDSGEYKIDWDGKDSDGNTLEDGLFYYEISAVDEYGDSVEVQTTYSGLVNGISFEDSQPYLITDEGTISVDSVIRVYEPD
ncbi:MAG: FlgD immunoglobulin-like domain containing protein [Desulfobacteraceae bacterium]|jgi:flagellar basal-body rod modification protein FlgD